MLNVYQYHLLSLHKWNNQNRTNHWFWIRKATNQIHLFVDGHCMSLEMWFHCLAFILTKHLAVWEKKKKKTRPKQLTFLKIWDKQSTVRNSSKPWKLEDFQSLEFWDWPFRTKDFFFFFTKIDSNLSTWNYCWQYQNLSYNYYFHTLCFKPVVLKVRLPSTWFPITTKLSCSAQKLSTIFSLK